MCSVCLDAKKVPYASFPLRRHGQESSRVAKPIQAEVDDRVDARGCKEARVVGAGLIQAQGSAFHADRSRITQHR